MTDSRKSYTVDLQGIPHTMLLTQEDADKYGERAVLAKSAAQLKREADTKAASAPANKAATAQNK